MQNIKITCRFLFNELYPSMVLRSYGSFTLPGTGTGTGTGNWEMGMQPNGFPSLSRSLCSVYSTQCYIETHHFPVPVPVPGSVNVPLKEILTVHPAEIHFICLHITPNFKIITSLVHGNYILVTFVILKCCTDRTFQSIKLSNSAQLHSLSKCSKSA